LNVGVWVNVITESVDIVFTDGLGTALVKVAYAIITSLLSTTAVLYANVA
jgi:hypothetical protein